MGVGGTIYGHWKHVFIQCRQNHLRRCWRSRTPRRIVYGHESAVDRLRVFLRSWLLLLLLLCAKNYEYFAVSGHLDGVEEEGKE